MTDEQVIKRIEEGFGNFMKMAFATVPKESSKYHESRKIWLAAITYTAQANGEKNPIDLLHMGLAASEYAMQIINLKGRN